MVFSKVAISREDYLRKKRNKRIMRWGISFLVLILLVGVASYVSHLPQFRISKITLSGGILVTESEVAQETIDFVSGSYVWLFPKNNVLWYPHKKLAVDLKSKFQRIDTVNMNLLNFHTLAIKVTEKEPVATWCDTLPRDALMEDGSIFMNCYFVDSNGTIFASAPYFSGDAYFKYYGLISSPTPIGESYLASPALFLDMMNFVNDTRGAGLDPQYIAGKENGEFTMSIAGGGEIYFDTRESLSQVSKNLNTLISQTKQLATSTKTNLPIDYIDLRYGNKLFYKMKN